MGLGLGLGVRVGVRGWKRPITIARPTRAPKMVERVMAVPIPFMTDSLLHGNLGLA